MKYLALVAGTLFVIAVVGFAIFVVTAYVMILCGNYTATGFMKGLMAVSLASILLAFVCAVALFAWDSLSRL